MKLRAHRKRQLHKTVYSFHLRIAGIIYFNGRRMDVYGDIPTNGPTKWPFGSSSK